MAGWVELDHALLAGVGVSAEALAARKRQASATKLDLNVNNGFELGVKGPGRARDWFDRNATLSALVSV